MWMASEIPEGLEELFEQSWFDHVLHYGLLIGAVFQIICIGAIVFLPPTPQECQEEDSSGDLGYSGKDKTGTGKTDESGKSGSGSAGVGAKKGGGKKARKRK